MSIVSRLACSATLVLGLSLLPAPARACWDGVYVESPRLSLAIATDGASDWSPERARAYAKWAARIGALVPPGTTVTVEHGYVMICDDTSSTCSDVEATWDDPYLSNLFELVADVVDAPDRVVARARAVRAEPLTVQVAASRDLERAHALAARINEEGLHLHGFLTIGGFPADSGYAHVVERWSGDELSYEVVVGGFLEREEAEAARGELAERLGLSGFVRVLDQQAVDEWGC